MLSNKSSLQMEGAKTMVHVGLRFAWNSLLGVAKTLLLLVLFSIVYIYIYIRPFCDHGPASFH